MIDLKNEWNQQMRGLCFAGNVLVCVNTFNLSRKKLNNFARFIFLTSKKNDTGITKEPATRLYIYLVKFNYTFVIEHII